MAKSESISELEQLRARLEEAEETLTAIRSGEVDALVVSGPHGEQIYTLRGADHSYRVLLEDRNEKWIKVLPSIPSVRPRSHSSRKPISSLKSL